MCDCRRVKSSGRTTTTPQPIQPVVGDLAGGRAARGWALVARRRSSTRSTSAASRTRTATGSATSRACCARLPYLRDLGVDALWFNPWYPSPMADTRLRRRRLPRRSTRRSEPSSEAEQLIAEARALGIRTIVDIVPNHVSDQHPWFRAALAVGARIAGAGALLVPARAQERTASCRRTAGSRSSAAPAGRASTDDERRARASGTSTCSRPSSPTSTGRTPTCGSSTRTSSGSGSTAASPGVRIDSAALLVKDPELAEEPARQRARASTRSRTATSCTTIYRALARDRRRLRRAARARRRGLAARRRAVRALPAARRAAHRVQLRLPGVPVGAGRDARVDRRRRSRRTRRSTRRRPGCSRTTTSPGRSRATAAPTRRSRSSRSGRARRPTSALGTRRARAAALLAMALPGSMYVYQGEELGLPGGRGHPARAPPGPDVAAAPAGVDPGRDGCRVPLPWAGDAAAVRLQRRRGRPALARPARRLGAAHGRGPVRGHRPRCSPSTAPACASAERAPWARRRDPALAPLRRRRSSRSRAAIASSASSTSARIRFELPAGASVLIASDELEGGALPQDTTVWLRQANGQAPSGDTSTRPDHRNGSTRRTGIADRCSRKGVTMKSTRTATIAAVAAASLLAACVSSISSAAASSAGAAKVTISVASLIPGSTKAATQQFNNQVEEFEKANPTIKVKSVEYQWTGPTFAAQARRRHAADRVQGAVHRRPHARRERPARRPDHAGQGAAVLQEVQPGRHRRGHDVERQDRRPCRPRRTRRRCTTTASSSRRPGSTRTSRRRRGPRSRPMPSRSRRRPARPATPRWARTTTPPAGS